MGGSTGASNLAVSAAARSAAFFKASSISCQKYCWGAGTGRVVFARGEGGGGGVV